MPSVQRRMGYPISGLRKRANGFGDRPTYYYIISQNKETVNRMEWTCAKTVKIEYR